MGKPRFALCCIITMITIVAAVKACQKPNENLNLWPLTIIHINDFHARFEANNNIGGFARLHTVLKELMETYKDKNPIYLNGGDNVQGTEWFTLLGFKAYEELFFERQRPLAMTFGNHEFSNIRSASSYLQSLKRKNIPVLVSNMKMNGNTLLDKALIQNSIIVDIQGQKVGIIGVIYDGTHTIAQTGGITFTSAIEAVKREAEHLKFQQVDKIIVISHCGLQDDEEIARVAGDHIDIIVGAHTHSFLHSKSAEYAYDQKDEPAQPYPYIVEKDGRKVFIVQAKSWGKYVGRITLYFDEAGEIQDWDGGPVFVNENYVEDLEVSRAMEPFKKRILREGSTVIGTTETELDGDNCREGECLLGSLVADIYADVWKDNPIKPIAMVHGGTFKKTIPIGTIRKINILNAIPWTSRIDLIELSGRDLKAAIIHSMKKDGQDKKSNWMQVSGLKISLDGDNLIVKIKTEGAVEAAITDESPEGILVQDSLNYTIAVPDFLADGKEGFTMMANRISRKAGPEDLGIIMNYIKNKGVITMPEKNRFQVSKDYVNSLNNS